MQTVKIICKGCDSSETLKFDGVVLVGQTKDGVFKVIKHDLAYSDVINAILSAAAPDELEAILANVNRPVTPEKPHTN